jgi:hypothetical protein
VTARHALSPLVLLSRAAGPPTAWIAKSRRLGTLLSRYGHGTHRDRLERLHALGIVDSIPSHAQLFAGSIDMLRFWISPAAADYYAAQGIDYTFHQVLRFLDEPASLGDPIGFFSDESGIIGHLMQVVHANPVYDLQLLMMYEHGLDQLEAELASMLDGSHPRAGSIGAIVEEPDYHARLLSYVREFRRDPTSPPPLRSNIGASFAPLERTFGSLSAAMRYFTRLPSTWPAALNHLRTTKVFPMALAEPL